MGLQRLIWKFVRIKGVHQSAATRDKTGRAAKIRRKLGRRIGGYFRRICQTKWWITLAINERAAFASSGEFK